MKTAQVVIGQVYRVKVSGRIARVRIDHKLTIGKGWHGTNLDTERRVHIRTAQRLRSVA